MPRKTKAFKGKLREAQKAYKHGDKAEANKIWNQVTLDRAKLKAEKAAAKKSDAK